MTARNRITLNVAATYGRSLVGLVCGLFTARWVLMVLGERDFGVWSVVGGLTAFVSFLNALFAGATARYFAYWAGEETKGELRDWFRMAVLVHLMLATLLVVVGYPVGAWTIECGLDIPPERMDDALMAFRLVAISCWVGMATVPFSAMYTARQNIAELSVFALVQSIVHFAVLGYAVQHPGDWFVPYVACVVAINVVPQLLIVRGAIRRYPVCRGFGFVADFGRRFREMGAYAFWQVFGGLGMLARTQGLNVVLNRLGGTSANASFGVASQLNGQVQSLSAALQGAFTPVITTAYGSGEKDAARRYAFRACRLSLLLMLVFSIPLMLELDEVLKLWLVTPPNGASMLCMAVIGAALVDKATAGHVIALNANGVLGGYQITVGTILVLSLPIAWGLYRAGWGLFGVGMALIVGSIAAGLGRAFFARRLVGMRLCEWGRGTLLPVFLLSLLEVAVGALPRLWMPPSFGRICVTTAFTLVVSLPLAWFAVLTKDERVSVLSWNHHDA